MLSIERFPGGEFSLNARRRQRSEGVGLETSKAPNLPAADLHVNTFVCNAVLIRYVDRIVSFLCM